MHDINLKTVDAGEAEVVVVDREGRDGEAVERDVDGVDIVGGARGARGVLRMGNGGDLIVVVNVGGGEGVPLLLHRQIPLHNHVYSRASESVLWKALSGEGVLYICLVCWR
jgi:hypothetical protein